MITLPLFKAFQVRLVWDQLVQVKVRKVRLGQITFTQDFDPSKNPEVTPSIDPFLISKKEIVVRLFYNAETSTMYVF